MDKDDKSFDQNDSMTSQINTISKSFQASNQQIASSSNSEEEAKLTQHINEHRI